MSHTVLKLVNHSRDDDEKFYWGFRETLLILRNFIEALMSDKLTT